MWRIVKYLHNLSSSNLFSALVEPATMLKRCTYLFYINLKYLQRNNNFVYYKNLCIIKIWISTIMYKVHLWFFCIFSPYACIISHVWRITVNSTFYRIHLLSTFSSFLQRNIIPKYSINKLYCFSSICLIF